MVTIKEVKSYLNGARNINKQLKILEKALVNVVEDDINIVPAYGKDYVDSGRVSKPTEEEAIKLDDIDEAPTIDAVEVVRCKDCKHFDDSYPMCCRFEETFEPDDYCSFGEKREVEE